MLIKAYCTLEEGKYHWDELLKHFPGEESIMYCIFLVHVVISASESLNVDRNTNMQYQQWNAFHI